MCRGRTIAAFCLLTVCARVVVVRPSDVLVVFPTTAQSHYRVVRPLVHGLLDRGHTVLSVTNFPDRDRRANLSHLNIAGLKPHSEFAAGGLRTTASRVLENVDKYEAILAHPPVVDLLRSGRKFDLVVVEYFTTTPMFARIATALNAPVVGVCPMMTFPGLNELMGEETVPSYAPALVGGYTDRMSFFQRLGNAAIWTLILRVSDWFLGPKFLDINERHYGVRTDPMSDIRLVLTNNYHSVFMPFPRVPGVIEVGGIHVEDEKHLPPELNDFINDADHGVVLFSMGSVVSESFLDEEIMNNIFKTFSKLKQKVIMKFNNESHATRPTNVKIIKWFPQRDLLAHPKVLLFISHAGLMSVIETIHCGKPMVAIPIFGDQHSNANLLVEKQMAVTLDYKNFKNDLFFKAINEALTEKYRINAKKLQYLYNDRPQSPLETAIYWTEYVIRNKYESKQLLKSPKIHLNFYQTYLIDIFAVFILPLVIATYIILLTIARLRKH